MAAYHRDPRHTQAVAGQLATPKRLRGKWLPGDPNRNARLSRILTDALPPRINDQTEERGTFLNWVDWALNALANGHTTWTTEVVPTATIEALYEREVGNVADSGIDRGVGPDSQPARPLR